MIDLRVSGARDAGALTPIAKWAVPAGVYGPTPSCCTNAGHVTRNGKQNLGPPESKIRRQAKTSVQWSQPEMLIINGAGCLERGHCVKTGWTGAWRARRLGEGFPGGQTLHPSPEGWESLQVRAGGSQGEETAAVGNDHTHLMNWKTAQVARA